MARNCTGSTRLIARVLETVRSWPDVATQMAEISCMLPVTRSRVAYDQQVCFVLQLAVAFTALNCFVVCSAVEMLFYRHAHSVYIGCRQCAEVAAVAAW